MSITHHERILEQYASAEAQLFYRHIMGDGSDHIHYGIYNNSNTSMRDALLGASRRLLDISLTRVQSFSLKKILDLGAGAGGTAKCLLDWTDAKMTCVDLNAEPLRILKNWTMENNYSSRLCTFHGSYEELPSSWNHDFDLVWSQEAICHALNRDAVFSEAKRVLRAGGAFVFSDILLAPELSQEQAKAFTNVNTIHNLGTLQAYKDGLHQVGFVDIRCEDWTMYLPLNFLRMQQQIVRLRPVLLQEGVSLKYLDQFAEALEERIHWPVGSKLQWYAFHCSVH